MRPGPASIASLLPLMRPSPARPGSPKEEDHDNHARRPQQRRLWIPPGAMTPLGSPASVAAAEAAYLKTRDARKAARRTKKPKAIVGRGKTYEKRLQDATLKYLKTLPHVTAW